MMSVTTVTKRDSHAHVTPDITVTDVTNAYRHVTVSRLSVKLASIHCLEELYGFANRRKVLNTTDDTIAPRWTDEERGLILARKYELELKQK